MGDLGQLLIRDIGRIQDASVRMKGCRASFRPKNALQPVGRAGYQPWYMDNPVYPVRAGASMLRPLPIRDVTTDAGASSGSGTSAGSGSSVQQYPVAAQSQSSFIPMHNTTSSDQDWYWGKNWILVMILILVGVIIVGFVLYQLVSIGNALAFLVQSIARKT